MLKCLNYKDVESLNNALQLLDAFIIRLPSNNDDLSEDILKVLLERISLAQDELSKLQRAVLNDHSLMRSHVKTLKNMYKIEYDRLMVEKSSHTKRIPTIRAEVSYELKDKSEEIVQNESLLEYLDYVKMFLKSKREDYQQKKNDVKMLYRVYESNKPVETPIPKPKPVPVRSSLLSGAVANIEVREEPVERISPSLSTLMDELED